VSRCCGLDAWLLGLGFGGDGPAEAADAENNDRDRFRAGIRFGFKEGAMRFERITVEPDKMGGVPCVRGLRIPVATIVGMVAEGMTVDEILSDYPDLEAADIREALEYAAEAVRERELPLRRGA
jgi:uncharacterized protein (DUF433 family)